MLLFIKALLRSNLPAHKDRDIGIVVDIKTYQTISFNKK